MSQRVCVIGAGPSGTAVLRAFKSAQDGGAEIPEIVCYEKQKDLGGLWNYNWRTGIDEHGENVHGSMYRYLWSNGPKEALEFADYHFEDHFGKPIPSFPPRAVLCDYIKGRIDKANVRDWIKCNTAVKSVTYNDDTQKFTVTVCDLPSQANTTEEFDYCICCSGHFSTPNVPEFEGFDKFQGRILHAHDFRDAVEMKGRNILIIGTSYSAEDIASQVYKYGVGSVTLSWRTNPMSFHWPENFRTVPLLQKVEGKTCHFKDGQTAEIDDIILCTGYKHHFPFLADDLRLKTANKLCVGSEPGSGGPENSDLHCGIYMPTNPKMMFLGMQDQWFTFNMFDAQAWHARDFILGRLQLPGRETMAKEHAEWWNKEKENDSDEKCIRYQADDLKRLVMATDYSGPVGTCWNVDLAVQEFLKWEHNKHDNIMTFRDKPHISPFTGTEAPVHHSTWLEALDDSLECYMQTGST